MADWFFCKNTEQTDLPLSNDWSHTTSTWWSFQDRPLWSKCNEGCCHMGRGSQETVYALMWLHGQDHHIRLQKTREGKSTWVSACLNSYLYLQANASTPVLINRQWVNHLPITSFHSSHAKPEQVAWISRAITVELENVSTPCPGSSDNHTCSQFQNIGCLSFLPRMCTHLHIHLGNLV